jgi:hypothetical protein
MGSQVMKGFVVGIFVCVNLALELSKWCDYVSKLKFWANQFEYCNYFGFMLSQLYFET